MQKGVLKYFVTNKIFLILLILGVTSWSIPLIKSGLIYDYGMGFWGANGHDGVWHIALAKSLARGSWDMPTISGERLQNYHVGFDLFLSFFHTITRIPVETLYFQIFPPIISFLVGFLTFNFVKKWRNSLNEALWAVFFVYFGGSFGWIVTFIRDGKFGGESMFWSQQAVSTLINPPFALSLVFLLVGLIFLLKKHNIYTFLVSALLFGLLIQIKAYAGVLAIGGLFVSGIFRFIKVREYFTLIVAIFGATLSFLLFLPLNKSASNLLVWQPFWFLENMMVLTDRVGWVRFGEAALNYKSGAIWWKAIPAYAIAFLIFWVGNIGTRVAKEIYIAKKILKWRTIDHIDIFLISVIVAGVIIPTFFLQKGTPWNTIQFLYYSLFFSSILAGIAVANIQKNLSKNYSKLFMLATVVFTVPTSLSTLVNDYIPSRPPAYISPEELAALSFLAGEPKGVVFTYPFDEYKSRELAKIQPNRPLYRYVSTAYVSAFSNKPVFLEDEMNADITGYRWQERRKAALIFLASLNATDVRAFLTENNISYIYWLHGQRATLGETQLGIERIFENKEVDIYKVVKN